MDNFELNRAALDMAQGATPYELARKLVQARARLVESEHNADRLGDELEQSQHAHDVRERERDEARRLLSEARTFVAFAYSKGVVGAEDVGRKIDRITEAA